MNDTYGPNQMWTNILKTFDPILQNKSIPKSIIHRTSCYNPQSHGILFFKNILFQMAQELALEEKFFLKKITKNVQLESLSINYEEINITLDYIQAKKEAFFIFESIETVKKIIEIGPGYGRTCHSIISLMENIEDYTIVDLPEFLDFSKNFLKFVLAPELFKKIRFLDVTYFESSETERSFDLAININSMQEMSSNVTKNYLNFIDKKCDFFYSNNTMGKFVPEDLGFTRSPSTDAAVSAGILTEYVNFFCPRAREEASKKYLEAFLPGIDWRVVKHDYVKPYSHYYQALYTKNLTNRS